jgi:hypothetical protein
MSRNVRRIKTFAASAVFVILATASLSAQVAEANRTDLTAPLEPLRPEVNENRIVLEMVARNALRSANLADYSDMRTYRVADLNGKVHAEEVGRMEYRAPDKKSFVETSQSGSSLIRHLALKPLIASEIETAAGKEHRDSSIGPNNYMLHLLGEQQVRGHRCFVAEATPRRPDKYLFEGKVWIDVVDYAIVRIEGHPAKKLSFWIERADFVREYQKIGKFWLPQRDETVVQVRLYGRHVLIIDHQRYVVNASPGEQSTTAEERHPDVP